MKKLKMILAIFLVSVTFSLLTLTVHAAQGSGTLFAYSNAGYTALLPTDNYAGGSWVVQNGDTVYLQIAGITEFNVGTNIQVIVGYTDSNNVGHDFTMGSFPVKVLTSGAGTGLNGVGDEDQPMILQVGVFDNGEVVYIPTCNTMTVHYRLSSTTPTYVAAGTLVGGESHLHVVPEYLYGGLAAVITCFVGFATFRSRSSIRAKIYK